MMECFRGSQHWRGHRKSTITSPPLFPLEFSVKKSFILYRQYSYETYLLLKRLFLRHVCVRQKKMASAIFPKEGHRTFPSSEIRKKPSEFPADRRRFGIALSTGCNPPIFLFVEEFLSIFSFGFDFYSRFTSTDVF